MSDKLGYLLLADAEASLGERDVAILCRVEELEKRVKSLEAKADELDASGTFARTLRVHLC